MIFLVIFAGIALKLENVGPIFSILNPCPSLIAISYNRKQFQCVNVVLNNKSRPLFLEFNENEEKF